MDLLAELNDPQRQAVTCTDGPLLVLAGAGSGKTRLITRRVAYLIHQGVAPWHVLAITFTNKAAKEMSDRVAALDTPGGATICTFHSLCARLLREFAAEAGLKPNYSIYDRADQVRLVAQAMDQLEIPTGSVPPQRVHSAISSAKNELKTPDIYAGQAEQDEATDRGSEFFAATVAAVYEKYEALLTQNNALDFDDLLGHMARLIDDRPDIAALLTERYQYVLIDEYQDTNRAQYILARAIAAGHHNICVTGDPDQSIYAWRGADIRNILRFEHDYPAAPVIRLEENYRSTAPILTAAAALIANNRRRKAKSLWTNRMGGRFVRVLLCSDAKAEAAMVAKRIAAHHASGGDYSDVAVFYRINSLSRLVEESLCKAPIPYRIARGIEFYNRKEIKDALAYLKLLVNGDDDLSCLRIINTPARGIGAVTVKRLLALAGTTGISVLEAAGRGTEAGLGAAAARRTAAFAELIASLAAEVDRPVRDVVEDVVSRSCLEQALNGEDSPDRRACRNLGELINTAAEFDTNSDGGPLGEYLHQVSLVSDVDHFDGGSGAVTLMTLHAAKGLEFPVVFIIGCEQRLLPFERGDDRAARPMQRRQMPPAFRAGRPTDLEEERRLAFVGMTRAKDDLTLTCARRRMVRGQVCRQAASPFLTEIGTECVEVEDLTWSDQPSRPPGRHGRGRFYADVEERAAIEAHHAGDDYEEPLPPEYEYLRVGCRVDHPEFGPGHVTKVGRRPWPDTSVDIHFETCGPKTIVLRFANLELLGE